MKKFLVILMVIAMASFLFVGCLPGVTPGVDDEEDEDVGVKTETPVITGASNFDILATTTEYVTAAPTIDGVAVPGAVVKLYIDGVYAGITYAATNGVFTGLAITGITLTEGERKVSVTATLSGFAESDKSTEYAFTYDETSPTIVSVVGDSSSEYITVTFSEPVDADTVAAATWEYDAGAAWIVAPATAVTVVVVPSTTTAILYEGTVDLVYGEFLSVECSVTAIEDLAGNEMDIPVVVHGFVVE